MTENEAIKAIKDNKPTSGYYILNESLDMAMQALETVQKYKDLKSELSKRNLTIDHIREYIQFEDECIKKGFTFDSLLSARSKMEARKPVIEENKLFHTRYYHCPICGGNLKIGDFLFNYCRMCGQKIDWEVAKNE
jgi:hypothetical protein